LKELFRHSKKKRKDSIVTVVDFPKAFGSVPQELIMSMLKQLNFPEWVRSIVKDMHEDAKSTIEYHGNQIRGITWRKGVKQACPESRACQPLLGAITSSDQKE
jgi:hypothetical protein